MVVRDALHRTAQTQRDAGRGQLGLHQASWPQPGRLAVPQRWAAVGQTGCGHLFCAGIDAPAVLRLGQRFARGQFAFAFDAVLQHPGQAPVLGVE